MSHSPLPWKYEKKDGIQSISDAQGELLFYDEPYDNWCSSEDMPFVVKAANTREILMAALMEISEMEGQTLLGRCCVEKTCAPTDGALCELQLKVNSAFSQAANVAKKAIAKAEEE